MSKSFAKNHGDPIEYRAQYNSSKCNRLPDLVLTKAAFELLRLQVHTPGIRLVVTPSSKLQLVIRVSLCSPVPVTAYAPLVCKPGVRSQQSM